MSGNEQRPGGWVDGIGWVARLGDLDHEQQRIARYEHVGSGNALVIVTRWADGTSPVPPAGDEPRDRYAEILRRMASASSPGTESTAALLAGAAALSAVPPAGDGRPDTERMRTLAALLPVGVSARAAMVAAADWIDAHPSVRVQPQRRDLPPNEVAPYLLAELVVTGHEYLTANSDADDLREALRIAAEELAGRTGHLADQRAIYRRAVDGMWATHADAAPGRVQPQPDELRAAITDEMLRAAEVHHGDSCSYCNSAGDIDCPTAAVLDALAASPATEAPPHVHDYGAGCDAARCDEWMAQVVWPEAPPAAPDTVQVPWADAMETGRGIAAWRGQRIKTATVRDGVVSLETFGLFDVIHPNTDGTVEVLRGPGAAS